MAIVINSRSFDKTNNTDPNDVEEVEAALDILHANDESIRDEVENLQDGTVEFTTPKVSGDLDVDEINEFTAANGITVDGLAIKDSAVTNWLPQYTIHGMIPRLYYDGSNNVIRVPKGTCTASDGKTLLTISSNIDIDDTTTGINALDTGTIASGWNYIYVCSGSSGTGVVLSTATTSGSVTKPSGYDTYIRKLPTAWRWTGSRWSYVEIVSGWPYRPEHVYYGEWLPTPSSASGGFTNVVRSGTGTNQTATLSTYVPPNSRVCKLWLGLDSNAGIAISSALPSGLGWVQTCDFENAASADDITNLTVFTNASQQIRYTVGGGDADISVVSYTITEEFE